MYVCVKCDQKVSRLKLYVLKFKPRCVSRWATYIIKGWYVDV